MFRRSIDLAVPSPREQWTVQTWAVCFATTQRIDSDQTSSVLSALRPGALVPGQPTKYTTEYETKADSPGPKSTQYTVLQSLDVRPTHLLHLVPRNFRTPSADKWVTTAGALHTVRRNCRQPRNAPCHIIRDQGQGLAPTPEPSNLLYTKPMSHLFLWLILQSEVPATSVGGTVISNTRRLPQRYRLGPWPVMSEPGSWSCLRFGSRRSSFQALFFRLSPRSAVSSRDADGIRVWWKSWIS